MPLSARITRGMPGIQVSRHLSKTGRIECAKQTTASKQPITRPKLWTTGSRHERWATSFRWKHPKWLQPFTDGFTRDRQVRQTFLQLTCKIPPPALRLPRIVQQHLLQSEQEKSTIYSLILWNTRTSKYADVRKLRERHVEEILKAWRTGLALLNDLAI